jgi:hypothetical protein
VSLKLESNASALVYLESNASALVYLESNASALVYLESNASALVYLESNASALGGFWSPTLQLWAVFGVQRFSFGRFFELQK